VLRRLFRKFEAPPSLRPTSGPAGIPGDDALAIRWLGTAAFRLRRGGKTVLLDPFVSRPGPRKILRPLRSDEDAIARWAPEADLVVAGHSHYDHLLDAPAIARRTGALVLGSESTARVARAAGVEPARILVASEAATILGPFEVDLVPSLHARLVLGIAPPFPGTIEHVPANRPLYVHEYRVGGAFGILARAGDVSVYHNGSADLIDARLEGRRADVLLVGLAGRKYAKGYLERLVRLLEPRVIVPMHYDTFFWPVDEELRLLPGVRLEEFLAEAAAVAPHAIVAAPSPFEELLVSEGGRRVAVRPARDP
jgi:L-ascorbate metabolism protein UlaG (beta-lactamase superfamily)